MNDYPTKKQLKKVNRWEVKSISDYREYMQYIKSIWHWEDYFVDKGNDVYELHTGGWSGNEDIIGEMMRNVLFWINYWKQSRRGGHYIFSPMRHSDGRLREKGIE